MDRIKFIGLTRTGNPVSTIDDLVKFFDHTIAAYEIAGDIEPTSVMSGMDDIHSTLVLRINSSDSAKLHEVMDYANGTINHHKRVYGKDFIINASMNEENSIELFVRDETM